MNAMSRDADLPSSAPKGAMLSACLVAVHASAQGLTSPEAALRLRRQGRNVLEVAEATWLSILVRQFRSPLVLILLVAAALSLALGETDEALIITGIVMAGSALGFYQEYRASRIVEALERRLEVRPTVWRDGAEKEIAAAELVPGDVMILSGGSLIAADAVLLEARDLQVEEAALTGESFPRLKLAAPGEQPLEDDNFVHMGTSVRSGLGRALVLKTGNATQYGALSAASAGAEPETSFARGIQRFGLLMTQIMLVIVTLVLVANVLLGRPVIDSLLFAAALAVGLTPELLPAVVTVTMAGGARRLAEAGVLVKRLIAIENLGAMDVLCTDKTGTLTEGEVRLDRAIDVEGAPSAQILRLAALNARLHTGLPNPLDAAIAAAAPEQADVVALGEVPYDFERKRLSVLVGEPDGGMLICKGAVVQVLDICGSIENGGQAADLTPERRAQEEQRLAAWSGEGLRALALARKPMPGRSECALADEAGMVLVGYLLFADPPKAGISQTIASLRRQGIALKILSGDNRYVGAHLAQTVGMASRRMMTGAELARLNDRMLQRRALHVDLFVEVSPDQKERVVSLLRRSGKVVGYLGDGINDAPALRAADIGISVDSAVDAAKAAADVVLLRRDLGILLDGVIIGRTAFANTRKYIAITTSANLGNMISMAIASVILPFLPLLAKQILVNNFLSSLPLMAVSGDRVDPNILERAGGWNFGHLLRVMLGFGLVSSLFDGVTFFVLLAVFDAGEALFQTGWFVESLLTELIIVGVMRTQKPFHSSLPSPLLSFITLLVMVVAIALPYSPLAPLLGFQALAPTLMLGLGAIVIVYGLTSELLKYRLGSFQLPRLPAWTKTRS